MNSSAAPDILKPYAFRFTDGERRVFKAREGLRVSQHAEKYRIVESGPFQGPWRNDLAPYAVEPMDCYGLPYVRKILLCMPPQVCKTQIAFNCMHWAVDQMPGPMMYVMPGEKEMKRISRRRIIPMLRKSLRTRELLSPNPDDTQTFYVRFINGVDLMMAWAGSSAQLASESVMHLFLDETDKYPLESGREMDPITAAEIRTNAYPFTKKIMKFSTPNMEEDPITVAMSQEADEIRHWHVKCPICGEFQQMKFEQFTYPREVKDPREIARRKLARYLCEHCGMAWDDYKRNLASMAGTWVPDIPVERPAAIAFQMPSFPTLSMSLSTIVADHMRGQEDPGKLKVFVTQHEARGYSTKIQPKAEVEILKHRTEIDQLIVPREAIALTAGIDSQKRGFWYVVRAWAPDFTNWSVDNGFLANFDAVEQLLFKTTYLIQDSDKRLSIWRAGMDIGGTEGESEEELSRTEEIYEFIRKFSRLRVLYALKGDSHSGFRKVKDPTYLEKMPRSRKPIPGGLELRLVNTDYFKELIHWRLERKEDESQQFFLHKNTTEEYVKQLLAEELRRGKGNKREWKRIRRDNHYLDCEVYAAACVHMEWTPSFSMMSSYLQKEKEKQEVQKTVQPAQQAVARSKFMSN
jgi:phage terminase large subunit GpA-like protein